MAEQKFCQSCGMPMGETNEMYGLNGDGTKSEDYCSYCLENGAFTFNGTMDQMIEICVPHMAGEGSGMSEDQAQNMMHEFFPTLKRWKQA